MMLLGIIAYQLLDLDVDATLVANAGQDFTMELSGTVTLSSALSSDSDGTIASYRWTLDDGTVLGTEATLEFTPDEVGPITITLRVTDNDGNTAFDKVVANVTGETGPASYDVFLEVIAGNNVIDTAEANSDVIVTATTDAPDGTQVAFEVTGAITASFTADAQAGSATITIPASQISTLVDSDVFTVTATVPGGQDDVDVVANVTSGQACSTIFDKARSEASFDFNGGDTTDLVVGEEVPVNLEWVGCGGQVAPNASGGGRGLSVDVGSEVFDSRNGLVNSYRFTPPSTPGTYTSKFTWGNNNDPSLCTATVTYTVIAANDTGDGQGPGATPARVDQSSISFVNVSPDAVTMRWTRPDESNIAKYQLFREGTLIATINPTNTYTFTGLSASTNYTFSIRGRAADGTTGLSSVKSQTTASAPSTSGGSSGGGSSGGGSPGAGTRVEFIGWGTGSQFGNDGRTIMVNNPNYSGPGTFKDAVEQSGRRRIVFGDRMDVVIPVPFRIQVDKPELSIAGHTAPGSGVKLQATPENDYVPFRTRATDISVENMGFYQNNVAPGKTTSAHDAVNIARYSRRVVFSQCTMMWGGDETLSMSENIIDDVIHDITIQYCLIAQGLSQTNHPSGEHSKGLLVGKKTTRVSIHHNWLTGCTKRNPRCQADQAQILNNVIYLCNGDLARPITVGDDRANGPAEMDIAYNRVRGTVGAGRAILLYPESTFKKGKPNLYLKGNIHDGSRTSNSQPESASIANYGSNNASNYSLKTSPIFSDTPQILTHTDATGNALENYLRGLVGTHSWNRPQPDRDALAAPLNASPINRATQLY